MESKLKSSAKYICRCQAIVLSVGLGLAVGAAASSLNQGPSAAASRREGDARFWIRVRVRFTDKAR